MRRTAPFLLTLAVCTAGFTADSGCFEEVGRWGWGSPGPVSLDGDILSFGSGSVLVLADVSEPASPAIVGSLTLRRAIDRLEVRGGLAVVGTAGDGIWLVDVSDPAAPHLVAQVWPHPDSSPAWGASAAFDMEGDLLVVADPGALVVLDVSRPASPTEVGRLVLPGLGSGVVVQDRWAYVGAGQELNAIDLLDPSAPVLVATAPVKGSPAALEGDLLAVMDPWCCVTFVDVSERAAPVPLGSYMPFNELAIHDVVLDGATAWVADSNGIVALDLSDPTAPVEVAGPAFLPYTNRVAVRADLLVATAIRALALYDAGAAGAGPIGQIDVAADPRFVAGGGDVAWVAQTQPSAGARVSTLLALGPPPQAAAAIDLPVYAVATDGRLALVDRGAGVIAVVQVTSDGAPRVLDEVEVVPPDRFIKAVHLALDSVDGTAGLALVEDNDVAELYALDLSNPEAVTSSFLGGWPTTTYLRQGLAVDGPLGAVSVAGLVTLVDLVDAGDPQLAGELAAAPGEIALEADLLTIAGADQGLLVVDASDPEVPAPAGVLAPLSQGHYAVDVVLAATTAFVLEDHHLGRVIRRVDLSDPTRPVGRGWIEAQAETIERAGDLLVTNEGGSGVGLYAIAACGTTADLVADFSWSPAAPRVGETVQLSDASTGEVTSWRWELPDGTTTTEANPTFTFTDPAGGTLRLTVSDGTSTATAARTIAVQPPAEAPVLLEALGTPHLMVLPAAGRGPGERGTFWRTRLELTNPGDVDVTAALYFLEESVDGSGVPGVEVVVPPHRTLVFDDATAQLFRRESGTGAIVIAADGGFAGGGTVFTWGAGGTFGQGIPLQSFSTLLGPGPYNRPRALPGVREDAAFRTNVGLVNVSAFRATFGLSLYDAHGSLLGREQHTLPPFSHLQDTSMVARLAGGPLAGGSIVVNVSDNRALKSYASVIDNRTGDPTFIAASTGGGHLAVAAHTPGINGTFWRTDLELSSLSSAPVPIRVARIDGAGEPLEITLPGSGAVRIEDVLAAVDPTASAAPLSVSAVNGDPIAVTSRTFTPPASGEGTYGQTVPLGVSWASSVILTGLWETIGSASPSHRSNLGITNPTELPVDVTIELYDRRGTLLGVRSLSLPPRTHRQLNRVLAPFVDRDTQGAWARVSTATENGRFIAYASVIDDGTGDPVLRLPLAE